jgi:hypothetical protein
MMRLRRARAQAGRRYRPTRSTAAISRITRGRPYNEVWSRFTDPAYLTDLIKIVWSRARATSRWSRLRQRRTGRCAARARHRRLGHRKQPAITPNAEGAEKYNKLGSIVDMPFKDDEFDFVVRDQPVSRRRKAGPAGGARTQPRRKTGLVFGSVTSDMAPALIDRYDLLRGVKKLGTWWEWSELFFGNGFDSRCIRRDCTDALWAATLAANKGPGQWYADADSLRYSFLTRSTGTIERPASDDQSRSAKCLPNHPDRIESRGSIAATAFDLRSCRPCSIGWFHGAQASFLG